METREMTRTVEPMCEILDLWSPLPDFTDRAEPNHGAVLRVLEHKIRSAPRSAGVVSAAYDTAKALIEKWAPNGIPTMTVTRVKDKIFRFHRDYANFKKRKPTEARYAENVSGKRRRMSDERKPNKWIHLFSLP